MGLGGGGVGVRLVRELGVAGLGTATPRTQPSDQVIRLNRSKELIAVWKHCKRRLRDGIRS